MSKIIECIPNFSEGRNMDTIEALAACAKSVPGVALLDYSSDANHNRSVFTFAGEPGAVGETAFRLCKLASERIDMTKHTGEHPRIGAADVVPFVPIREVELEECVELSKSVAKRIWSELQIPSFLYEESASRPERRNLADIRRGQFEGMAEKLLKEEWKPDFGERAAHPTAGITVIGARMPLVAFNVNLGTPDVRIAKDIAKAVRGSSGGFQCCKAIGVMLSDRNTAQVSMNFVNCEKTPIYRVFEMIRAEAERWGVSIIGSELIGLAPAKSLIDCAEYYLKLERFDCEKQVLENRVIW